MRPNPSAYLDARSVAHVQMPEQQEGIPGPRIANMVRSLGLSRAAAERLREKMRRADETGDGIEDILREAQRLLRAKGVAYYPGAADASGAPDGIAFVDRGDPKAETLLYDHRDGRFTVNAWGPAVARQRERFSKNNPDPAKRYRDLQRMAAPGSGASENERAMAQRLLAKMTPPPEERPTPRTGGYSYSPPRRQPEPWQTDPRDSTEIYRNDLSDLNFAKKSIYEHASAPRVRVTLHGFDGSYGRSIFTAFSSLDDLGYAAKVLEAWGEPYHKKNGVFDAVIGMVEGESDARVLRVRGEDVSGLDLTLDHDSFNQNPFNDSSFARRLRALVETHTGAPMPTQFVTNPRRPAKKPAARRKNPASTRPSVKTLSQIVTREQANELRKLMEYSGVNGVLHAASRMMDGFGVEYIASAHDTLRTPDGLDFVNMGDTYDLTLIYDHGKGRFVVSSWGDIVEADMRLPKSRQRFAD